MWFPPGLTNIYVMLYGISGNSSVDFPIQMQSAPMSVIAVLHGHNQLTGDTEDGMAMYKSTDKSQPWYIDFPGGINLATLDVRLMQYNGPTA